MKTALLSLDLDADYACRQFNDEPTHKTFSAALTQVLLEASQTLLVNLQKSGVMQSYWRHTKPHVILYETLAYLWCIESLKVNETVQYAFDDDKNAVKRGVLDGLNRANALIRDHWLGFSPEIYAMSRMLFYPKEASLAAENFFRLLAASEGRDFPLFPAELPHPTSEKTALHPEFAASVPALVKKLYDGIEPALDKCITKLVSHYLDNRLEEPDERDMPSGAPKNFCGLSW